LTDGRRLGLLVCGAGRVIERLYVPALRRSQRFHVTGVVEPRPDRRAWAERVLSAPGFPSVDEALGATKADAALVATPAASHVAVASRLIDAGLPVLIEKPGATSVADADALLGRAGGKPVRLALSRRYWRRYRHLAAILLKGRRSGGWQLRLWTNYERWGAIDSGGPRTPAALVEDLLPHAYDLATAVIGADVSAVEKVAVLGKAVEISFGGHGSIVLADGPGWLEELSVELDGRTVELASRDWDLYPDSFARYQALVGGVTTAALARTGLGVPEPADAIARLLDDFASDIETGRQNEDLRRLAALFDAVRPLLDAASPSP
jgi:predicted dehydrogenase